MNLEKIIPEVWWDFFGRLIPGLVIAGQLYYLGYLKACNIPNEWSVWFILFLAYLIGHFLQPFGSRTEQIIASIYRNREIAKATSTLPKLKGSITKASLIRRVFSWSVLIFKSERKPSEPSYDFREIIKLPENFSENYVVAKKKHSEAVSFLSVFWPSYILWILTFNHPVRLYVVFAIALFCFTIIVIESEEFKNTAIICFASIATIFWFFWIFMIIYNSLELNTDYITALVPMIAGVAGIERTKNKLQRELWVSTTYTHSNESDKKICRQTLLGIRKD